MNTWKVLLELYKMKKRAFMGKKELSAFQERKLRKLLHLAWEKSDYYRYIYEKAGMKEEQLDTLPLSAFPAIEKKELLEHFDELVTVNDLRQNEIREYDENEQVNRVPYKGKYHVIHSSGSTGKPGYFVYGEKAWNTMLLGIIRAALWDMSMPQILKLLWKHPRIAYIAATDGRYAGAMAVGDGIEDLSASQMYFDINEPTEEWIKKWNQFKPNIVIGYPSAIKIMAQLSEQGKISSDIERVITCGEPLGHYMRHYLENVWNTQVVNFYGASESLALGVETDPDEGLYLFDDLNIIEVENGQMYLTCLYNETQPLIRYHITDSITLKTEIDVGRYSFSRAAGILGRNEDILWFEDDNGRKEFLHPLAIEGFCVEGLKDYQFQKTGRDSFDMYVETEKDAHVVEISNEIIRQLTQILRSKKMDFVKFHINFTGKILPDAKTGKKALVLNEREGAVDG